MREIFLSSGYTVSTECSTYISFAAGDMELTSICVCSSFLTGDIGVNLMIVRYSNLCIICCYTVAFKSQCYCREQDRVHMLIHIIGNVVMLIVDCGIQVIYLESKQNWSTLLEPYIEYNTNAVH